MRSFVIAAVAALAAAEEQDNYFAGYYGGAHHYSAPVYHTPVHHIGGFHEYLPHAYGPAAYGSYGYGSSYYAHGYGAHGYANEKADNDYTTHHVTVTPMGHQWDYHHAEPHYAGSEVHFDRHHDAGIAPDHTAYQYSHHASHEEDLPSTYRESESKHHKKGPYATYHQDVQFSDMKGDILPPEKVVEHVVTDHRPIYHHEFRRGVAEVPAGPYEHEYAHHGYYPHAYAGHAYGAHAYGAHAYGAVAYGAPAYGVHGYYGAPGYHGHGTYGVHGYYGPAVGAEGYYGVDGHGYGYGTHGYYGHHGYAHSFNPTHHYESQHETTHVELTQDHRYPYHHAHDKSWHVGHGYYGPAHSTDYHYGGNAHHYYGDAGAYGHGYYGDAWGHDPAHHTTTHVYTEKVHHEPIRPETAEKREMTTVPYHADPTAPHTHHEIEHREGSFASKQIDRDHKIVIHDDKPEKATHALIDRPIVQEGHPPEHYVVHDTTVHHVASPVVHHDVAVEVPVVHHAPVVHEVVHHPAPVHHTVVHHTNEEEEQEEDGIVSTHTVYHDSPVLHGYYQNLSSGTTGFLQ